MTDRHRLRGPSTTLGTGPAAGVVVLIGLGVLTATGWAQTTQPSPGGSASGTFQGHRYELVLDTTTSWTNAQSTAQGLGGYLVAITSAAEDQFVDSLLKKVDVGRIRAGRARG